MSESRIMGGSVRRSEFFFPSSLEGYSIHAVKWEPADGRAFGVVQLIHGMEEHIGRYDDFARFLAMRGFVVCGSSHIGHGRSVPSPDRISCLPEHGAQVMLSDVHTLRKRMSSEYPDLPYAMFGHSMGSFLLRVYLARFGEGLAGAIVCGTGQQPPLAARCANAIARGIGRTKGFDYKSAMLDKLVTGSFAKGVENPRTAFDWLSCDPSVVDEYIADPTCGVMFSAGGYASLTDLVAEAAGKACASRVPDGLPVLFIAGAKDPVGDFGKGPAAAAEMMDGVSRADVSLIIYEEMRHEILNEPDRISVYFDALRFIEAACGKVSR